MQMPDSPTGGVPAGSLTLTRAGWLAARGGHERRVDELTAGRRARAQRGLLDPVEDFLFTYYSLRPGRLRRWHPGAGVTLLDAGEYQEAPGYESLRVDGIRAARFDAPAFRQTHRARLDAIRSLLARTAAAPARFDCFGWHEWAMVFQTPDRRHPGLALRLGAADTDEVVRRAQIRCTHFDAFRFFTPPARELNTVSPAASRAERREQRGCLHATMDLYRWASESAPLVGSELLVDCFSLAREIRVLDMRASPYDLSGLGYSPVAVETAAGRATYVAEQRAFSVRGDRLRHRLLDALGPRCAA